MHTHTLVHTRTRTHVRATCVHVCAYTCKSVLAGQSSGSDEARFRGWAARMSASSSSSSRMVRAIGPAHSAVSFSCRVGPHPPACLSFPPFQLPPVPLLAAAAFCVGMIAGPSCRSLIGLVLSVLVVCAVGAGASSVWPRDSPVPSILPLSCPSFAQALSSDQRCFSVLLGNTNDLLAVDTTAIQQLITACTARPTTCAVENATLFTRVQVCGGRQTPSMMEMMLMMMRMVMMRMI